MSLSQGAVLQEHAPLVRVLHGSPTSPASKPASSMGFVPQGATAPARTLLKPRFPMGLQPCSGLHLLQCGVVHELQVDL